jgi:hypothetical protein
LVMVLDIRLLRKLGGVRGRRPSAFSWSGWRMRCVGGPDLDILPT